MNNMASVHKIRGNVIFTEMISNQRIAVKQYSLKMSKPSYVAVHTQAWQSYAPVILSRFSRYVVHTLLTPTFRRNRCWFQLGATLCHDVLRCCHVIATPEPRYCPVLTRLTSDTGKFSCVVLRYVSLPPRSSLAVATLSYAVPRIWRSITCHNEPET